LISNGLKRAGKVAMVGPLAVAAMFSVDRRARLTE
jgi:hypothetical protein